MSWIGARSLSELIRPTDITTEEVYRLRDTIQIGTKVKAEVFKVDTAGGTFGTELVTILKKYPYIALTNKGPIPWNDIAIKNKSLTKGGR